MSWILRRLLQGSAVPLIQSSTALFSKEMVFAMFVVVEQLSAAPRKKMRHLSKTPTGCCAPSHVRVRLLHRDTGHDSVK
jgi:hypothetical protein